MKQGPSFAVKQGTLIALACAAAFAVPQAASAAEEGGGKGFAVDMRMDGHPLTFQGNISVGYAFTQASGASGGDVNNFPGRGSIWTGESNIRFSASSRLGGSFFQAIGFQVESGFSTDDGTSSSTAGVLATRNTGLGVKTPIGSIWGGKWDTPYKSQAADYSVTASPNGLEASTTGWLGGHGFGGGTGGTANGGGSLSNAMNFRRRQVNTLNYYTPVIAGFKGAFQYSPDEELGQGPVTAKPQSWGARVEWTGGPAAVSLAYEKHDDYLWGALFAAGHFGPGSPAAGAGNTSDDKAYSIAGSYTFADTLISAYWEKLKWDQGGPAAVITGLDSRKWYLGVKQKISGPHSIAAAYGRAGSYGCSATVAINCNDSGAQLYNFLYRYQLDKVSYVNVFYGRYNNDNRGQWIPASGLTAGTVTGLDNTSWSVGFQSSF